MARGCVASAAGGGGLIAFHIWKKQMLHFLGARAAFPRCHCFRFHQREAQRLRISLFVLNPLRCIVVRTTLEFQESFYLFPTMGDIEAPNSNRPRQNVLLSVLPSKEFASSRKGMLLIAEVVRNYPRDHLGNKWNSYCAIVSPNTHKPPKRATFEYVCVLFSKLY